MIGVPTPTVSLCQTCGEPVVGYSLAFCQRFGARLRCAGTHCKHVQSQLVDGLRQLSSEPLEPPAFRTLDQKLSIRVALLERTLREHGLEVPP